jgi:hypothetical protein
MVRGAAISLLFCGAFIAASACYYKPVEIKSGSWLDAPNSTEHFYKVFVWQSATTNVARDWVTAHNWFEDNTTYDTEGWDFATITSGSEQTAVVGVLNTGTAIPAGQYWLGGRQVNGAASPSTGWYWITGETWSYAHWFSGEPNDYSTAAENGEEDFLAMRNDAGYNWAWNDAERVNAVQGFVAERIQTIPSVPEASIVSLLGTGLVFLFGFARKKRR